MNDFDLQKFYEEERRRDRLAAPPFTSLAGETQHAPLKLGVTPNPHPMRSRRGFAIALASAALVLIVTALTLHRQAPSVPLHDDSAATDLRTDLADLDELCDAALAALDEQEHGARIEEASDVLLLSDDSNRWPR